MGLFKKCLSGKSSRRVRQTPAKVTQLDLFNYFDFVKKEISNVRTQAQGSPDVTPAQSTSV